jgi:hypothetical protein
MDPSAIQSIIEAAKGEGAEEKIRILLDHATKQAADAAQGVEDTTAGLKSALAKTKAELESYRALGKPDEIQALGARLKTLEDEAEAGAHGAENEAVEKLAEERAERKSRQRIAEANAEAERMKAQIDKLAGDREHLVDRLRGAYEDFVLYRNGGREVEPLFWSVLRSKASPHLAINGNGADAEEGSEWWRGDAPDFPDELFAVVDKGGTRLSGKEGPMTPAELIQAKRQGEWAALWPDKRRGGGAGSERPEHAPQSFDEKTPASVIIESALPSR